MESIMDLYNAWKKVALRSPHLKIYHVILALWYYSSKGILGRYSLMNILGLTEATTKTLINFLKKNGILEPIPRRGHHLTQRGKLLGEEITKTINIIQEVKNLDELVICPEKCIVVVRSVAEKVSDGLKERDNAILAGACGATTLIVRKDRSIVLPNNEQLSLSHQSVLREILHLNSSDVIIIGSAKNKRTALLGALSAAVALFLSNH